MTAIGKKFDEIYGALYPRRRPFVLLLYGCIAALSYTAAYLLRFEFQVPSEFLRTLLLSLPIVIGVRVFFAWTARLTNGRWRHVSTSDLVRLVLATTAGSGILWIAAAIALPELVVPRSVLIMEWVLTVQATAGAWIGYRVAFEWLRRARSAPAPQRRTLIVGAGEAATLLARELQRFPTGFRLVGFVDDDELKRTTRIHGFPVVGKSADLSSLVRRHRIDELIIAIPSARPEELRRLVEYCEQTDVPFKVLPGIAEVLKGNVGIGHVRDLRIEDLLGREPVELELPELTDDVGKRCVLITGAAGSIGSELARQVALHKPETLLLFDQAETDLFFLEMELRRQHPGLRLVPVMGDIRDRRALERVFSRYRPDRVFHAAAYKHVPMLEANPEQAIANNVIGTYQVADAAGRHAVAKFILVSTDKAVRPANIMGASKRLAELVVLEMQNRYPATLFGAVRFGNVLGSSGSVLPIFRKQLESRRPLTVTHPDVTRYFMTIPEAVQLILQASLLPELRGHIAMLEMGEPVRIVDLAKNFLRLSGVPVRLNENIVFTGLRPGEKLHEELSSPGEERVATLVPKVYMLRNAGEAEIDVFQMIRRWQTQSDEPRDLVADVVAEFHDLHRRVRPQLEIVPTAGRDTAA
ncbi:MAG TPA: nucleoside-diphosphate sugar epimerase/dehydratase [Longimicrobiales bacterium]